MRDRLTELLPLLLVGLALVIFQLARSGSFNVPGDPPRGAEPTPDTSTLALARLPIVAVPTLAPRSACTAQQPRFLGGMASLRAALGPTMGDPLECEQPVDDQGDTQQRTTTGLAYYRRSMNVASFTTGWDHWGLVEGHVLHWAGGAVDPPADATVFH